MAIYKLGKIFNIRTGNTPSTNDETKWKEELFWYTVPDFNSNTHTQRKISFSAIKNPVPKETMLLTTTGALLGKTIISLKECWHSQQVTSFENDEKIILTKYLKYWFDSNQSYLKTLVAGAAIPTISKNKIEKLSIDAPGLEGQRNIIDIIEPLELIKLDIIKKIKLNDDLISKIILESPKDVKISEISKIIKYNKLIKSDFLSEEGKYFYSTGKVLSIKKKTDEKNFKVGVSIPYEGSVLNGKKLSPSLHEEEIYIARKWGIESQYYRTIFYTLKNTSSSVSESGVKMPKLSLDALGNIKVSKQIEDKITILHEIRNELSNSLKNVELTIEKSINFLMG